MKYRDLEIQTQREAPNNARTEGFAFLVRAGYLTRENVSTKLGKLAIDHLRKIPIEKLPLETIGNDSQRFFPMPTGNVEVAHCTSCKYTQQLELARFRKPAGTTDEAPLPLEKVSTPGCNTIELLANFLDVPKEKTAKALMCTRVSDGRFIFVVVRGDMQLSEAKLKARVGDVRVAGEEEIVSAGAAMGYASAIGLMDASIVVDDLIPSSRNLVAGANEVGWHFKNTNYGRDFTAEIVTDLAQAKEGDACIECGNPLSVLPALPLKDNLPNTLLALAEAHHDEKGLAIPHPAAPFDVYLMHVPGKELDTRAKAGEIHDSLQRARVSVLFDDRDERAGVKFNDADLIGPPLRVTVGEKGLREGMVELKLRRSKENQLVPIDEIGEKINLLLK